MIPVKTVKDFAKHNEKQLRKMFSKKTGIHDKDLIDDAVQEFYVRLIQTKALETYDEKEGAFNTYLFNLMCWVMPIMGRNNFRHNYEVLSTIEVNKNSSRSDMKRVDIWEVINGYGGGSYYHETKVPDEILKKQLRDEGTKKIDNNDLTYIRKNGKKISVEKSPNDITSYKIDPMFRHSFLESYEEEKLLRDFERFKDYVKKTESNVWSERMISYMNYRLCGCKCTDIAKMLKVTDAMIRYIKNKSHEKFIKWRDENGV